MCSCLEHAQQRTKAEEACKKALVGRPGRPTAVLQLARLLHGSNKHQEALDTLDQGLQHLSVCPSVTAHQCVEPQLNLVSSLFGVTHSVVLASHPSSLLVGKRSWLGVYGRNWLSAGLSK